MTMRLITLTAGFLMACFLELLQGQGDPDHKGTRFIVGFLDNNSTLPPELLVIPQTQNPVNVTVRLPSKHSPGSGHYISRRLERDLVTIITLPAEVRMSGTLIQEKGIEVTSTEDIVVYGLNRANGSRDAFLALPTDSLGQEYYVASYQPVGPYVSQVALVATSPNTRLDITVPVLNRTIEVRVHNTTLQEGDMHTVHMGLYDSLQLESYQDLTGVKVTANLPLVVISGDTSSDPSFEYTVDSPRDHIVEQMAPTKSWGRSFATVPFSSHQSGDVFRIIASQNDTNVEVRHNSTNTSYMLSESEHAEVNVTQRDYIAVDSDKPVLVLQYLPPEEQESVSKGSFMLIVPPMEQREGQYLFSTVDGIQQVNLVITSAMVEGLLLDGERISNESSLSWTLIESYLTNYSAIQLLVDEGFHNLSHDSSEALFSAMSYGYPLGMGLKDLPGLRDVFQAEQNESGSSTSSSTTTPKPTQRIKLFHEAGNEIQEDTGLTPTVIAVIVSLATAVFFVIVCIIGFILAECVCRRDYTFRSAKVKPMT